MVVQAVRKPIVSGGEVGCMGLVSVIARGPMEYIGVD